MFFLSLCHIKAWVWPCPPFIQLSKMAARWSDSQRPLLTPKKNNLFPLWTRFATFHYNNSENSQPSCLFYLDLPAGFKAAERFGVLNTLVSRNHTWHTWNTSSAQIGRLPLFCFGLNWAWMRMSAEALRHSSLQAKNTELAQQRY